MSPRQAAATSHDALAGPVHWVRRIPGEPVAENPEPGTPDGQVRSWGRNCWTDRRAKGGGCRGTHGILSRTFQTRCLRTHAVPILYIFGNFSCEQRGSMTRLAAVCQNSPDYLLWCP